MTFDLLLKHLAFEGEVSAKSPTKITLIELRAGAYVYTSVLWTVVYLAGRHNLYIRRAPACNTGGRSRLHGNANVKCTVCVCARARVTCSVRPYPSSGDDVAALRGVARQRVPRLTDRPRASVCTTLTRSAEFLSDSTTIIGPGSIVVQTRTKNYAPASHVHTEVIHSIAPSSPCMIEGLSYTVHVFP